MLSQAPKELKILGAIYALNSLIDQQTFLFKMASELQIGTELNTIKMIASNSINLAEKALEELKHA